MEPMSDNQGIESDDRDRPDGVASKGTRGTDAEAPPSRAWLDTEVVRGGSFLEWLRRGQGSKHE